MPKLVKTHKYCFPAIVGRTLKHAVFRRIPNTPEVAYCSRHASIQACCKALKKRFPAESSAFTPNKLLVKKPDPVDKQAFTPKMTKRPIARAEKIQYRGITPEVRYNGKVVWKVHHRYQTPKWQYDRHIEAATAIAHAEGNTLADLRHNKAKVPIWRWRLSSSYMGRQWH